MRILTISNTPLEEHLGSGYVVVNFARGLASRGHDVRALGPDDYEPLRSVSFGTGYKKAIGMAAVAVRELAKAHYDIIEFYGGECWLAVQLLRRLPRRRVLLVHHSNGIEPHLFEAVRRQLGPLTMSGAPRKWYQPDASRLFRTSFTGVDGVVTVSKSDADYAQRSCYQSTTRILAVENPLPPEYIGLKVNYQREPIIGFCGSWLVLKGISVFSAAACLILKEFEHARLKLVGVGSGFRKEEYFPPSLAARIEVIPFVHNKVELKRVYQTMALLVLPSYYESFGLVAAEAMANGCALVANRVGFAAHLADRHEAMICEEPTPECFSGCIRELLADDELRRRVATGGYARVQRLSWSDAVDTIEARYRAWLNEIRQAT